MENIGERVKALRSAQGLTQAQLAENVGVSMNVISNIERGYSGAKTANLDKIAAYFNVPTDYLIGRTNVRFQGNRKAAVFPERLKSLMEQNHITKEDLYDSMDLSEESISGIISGDVQPNIEQMASIASSMGTTIDYLVGATGYSASVRCEDEQDIITDYRRMNKTQRRLFLAELEKVMNR